MKVEGHKLLLKDLNVCLLMEAQCQARNMGSVRSDCPNVLWLYPRQNPPLSTFSNASHQRHDEGVVEGKGLPGAAYGLLLQFSSLFTVFNTAV